MMPTHTDFQPFLVTLTIGSPYIPPRAMPTLDALLWGAARLESPQCEDVAERIPLKRTDGVFHGSCMMCDPMFPDCEVKFFQGSGVRDDRWAAGRFTVRRPNAVGDDGD